MRRQEGGTDDEPKAQGYSTKVEDQGDPMAMSAGGPTTGLSGCLAINH